MLAVVGGEPRGGLFALADGESLLGAGSSCAVRLEAPGIAARHASLISEGGAFALLGHVKPTFVNAEPVDVCELQDGDVIRIGETTLRFRTLPGI